MLKTYVLNDLGEPTRELDLLKWGRWIERADREELRRVAYDVVPDVGVVSTVFLGLDHNLALDGPPLLFETMVFVDDDFHRWRYPTRAVALAEHERIVNALKKGVDPDDASTS